MEEFLKVSHIIFTLMVIVIAIPLVLTLLAPFILSGWISKREREEQDKRRKENETK